jgi:hypothetical protein
MKIFYTALCLLITVIAQAQTGKVPMRKSDPPPGVSAIIQPQQLSQAKAQVPIKAGDAQANASLSRMAAVNNKVPVQTGGAQTSNTNRRAAAAPQGNSKGPSSQDIPVSRPESKAVVPPVIEQHGTPPPNIQPPKTTTGIKKAVKN